MPPKKKGGKKNDDWDADMGETPDPIAAATQEAKDGEAAQDAQQEDREDSVGGGGLLAALKKNRGKKAKKGKVVEDFVDGEDPPQAETNGLSNGLNGDPGAVEDDIKSKAPQEASMEDEDVFAAPAKKGKGKPGKQAAGKKGADADGEGEAEELDESGKVKSKAQKDKEKKEREKQRKKEQVRVAVPATTGHADG